MTYLELQTLKILTNKMVNETVKYDKYDVLEKTREKVIDLMAIIVYRSLNKEERTIEQIILNRLYLEFKMLKAQTIKNTNYYSKEDILELFNKLRNKKVFNY